MSAWFPGAIVQKGKNAGYRRGHTKNQCAVLHFTVGLGDETGNYIRDNGLAAFYIRKDGRVFQYAEADAITAHACEWNDEGFGIEFERRSWDDPLTAAQIASGGKVILWGNATFHYPLLFHGGARLPIGSPFRGFVNHGSLTHHACDQHSDGVTHEEWNRMIEGDDMPLTEQDHLLIAKDCAAAIKQSIPAIVAAVVKALPPGSTNLTVAQIEEAAFQGAQRAEDS